LSLELTATHRKKMAAVLDQEHETLEEAAQAALDCAVEIFESRAKFAVVGQVRWSNGYLSPEDGRAAKVVLDWFPTRKKAETAGRSLAFSNQTNEEVRWWVVPVHHGSPHEWHRARKEEHQRASIEAEHGKQESEAA
jgi:hypothetical protein